MRKVGRHSELDRKKFVGLGVPNKMIESFKDIKLTSRFETTINVYRREGKGPKS